MIAIAFLAGAVVGGGAGVVNFGRVRSAPTGGAATDPTPARSGSTGDPSARFPHGAGAARTVVQTSPGASAGLPSERWWTALGTAAAFALVAWRAPSPWVVPAYCVLAAALVRVSAIDLGAFRIPRRAVYATWLLGAPLLVVASAGTGRWGALVQVVVAGVASTFAFAALHVAVRDGLGFGDVRLAGLCGGFLGWSSYRVALIGLLLGFVVAGVAAGVLVVGRRVSRDGRLPFAPMLALGTIAALGLGAR